MKWSYNLFKVFGIDVRVHVTFLLIVVYFAFFWGVLREPGGWGGALYGVMLVILLFALVVIHELTHSRVAQAYGIQVRNITLLPIGGMAMMGDFPRDPRKELAISVAGPASNLVIAAIMAAGALLFVDRAVLSDLELFFQAASRRDPRGTYLYLMAINVALAVFNLIPAFPLDGGRVFRAALSLWMGRERASRIAVGVGQILALLMGIYGLLTGNLLLILVATFIYFGAQAEGSGDDVGRVLGQLRVSQAVNTRVEGAMPSQAIGELAARLFHSYQVDFPVLEGGRVVGVMTRARLISSLGSDGPDRLVGEVMRKDFPVAALDERLFDAFARMRSQGVKAMPVMEGERLIGMVSMEDISEVYALMSAAGADFASRIPEGPPDSSSSAEGSDSPSRLYR
jgi:Zn-dependent protease/predicted transcriptional regulator